MYLVLYIIFSKCTIILVAGRLCDEDDDMKSKDTLTISKDASLPRNRSGTHSPVMPAGSPMLIRKKKNAVSKMDFLSQQNNFLLNRYKGKALFYLLSSRKVLCLELCEFLYYILYRSIQRP